MRRLIIMAMALSGAMIFGQQIEMQGSTNLAIRDAVHWSLSRAAAQSRTLLPSGISPNPKVCAVPLLEARTTATHDRIARRVPPTDNHILVSPPIPACTVRR